jgi:hypothetical protein
MIGKNLNLTRNQYDGLLLESATFSALKNLGVQPEPLHNPFDNRYAEDQHLSVDLIFTHNKRLYGIECKNLGHSSRVNSKFIQKEIVDRFNYAEIAFDGKVLVFGACHCKASIPNEFSVISLDYKVTFENYEDSIRILTKLLGQHLNTMDEVSPNNLKSSPTYLIDYNSSIDMIHGVNPYLARKRKLNRIDTKLRKKWLKLIYQGKVELVYGDLEGWICPHCTYCSGDEQKLKYHVKNKHKKEY